MYMTTNDPISDMLTRIRNAAAVKKADVTIPFSKVKLALAELLKSEGYIEDVTHIKGAKNPTNKGEAFDSLLVQLKYSDLGPAITRIDRVSKPGKRVYCKKDELPIVLSGHGISLLSTSQGLMTNRAAKKARLGGEVICKVY